MRVIGLALQFSGFVPNQEQTEAVKLALKSLYALYPFLCFCISAVIFSRFGLDEAEHSRIKAVLMERAAST